MLQKTKSEPVEKVNLHPRNQHRGYYDFELLIQTNPLLTHFVKQNAYQNASIDFANPQAVKALNKALLKQYYDIVSWDIPTNYLCPPIPGRADYLHYLADLLADSNAGVIPKGAHVHILDIGVGANVIYPLIGQHEYGWQFVGSDTDAKALANAQGILDANNHLATQIELRLQIDNTMVFKGIVKPDERYDLTMCNPPFHSSLAEASAGTSRKWQNLGKNAGKCKTLNFGGQHAELFCEGGEVAFIQRMIIESAHIKTQCLWFTSLVSKSASLPTIYRTLKKVNAVTVKTIEMAQGNKKSRFVAWTFLDVAHKNAWQTAKASRI